jgi:hypothetical protein
MYSRSFHDRHILQMPRSETAHASDDDRDPRMSSRSVEGPAPFIALSSAPEVRAGHDEERTTRARAICICDLEDCQGISLPATPSDGRLINCFYARIRSGRWRLAASDYGDAQQNEDGAFMEPSGRNRWQSVANAQRRKTAERSEIRCHGLPPVAVDVPW